MAFFGGQFKSATHGQFKSAQGGQFDRILQFNCWSLSPTLFMFFNKCSIENEEFHQGECFQLIR